MNLHEANSTGVGNRVKAFLSSLTGSRAVVGIPYFWLLIFFLLPEKFSIKE